MITQHELAKLLRDAEHAHKASGHSAAHWDEWYAQYLLPILTERMESVRELDGRRAWG